MKPEFRDKGARKCKLSDCYVAQESKEITVGTMLCNLGRVLFHRRIYVEDPLKNPLESRCCATEEGVTCKMVSPKIGFHMVLHKEPIEIKSEIELSETKLATPSIGSNELHRLAIT